MLLNNSLFPITSQIAFLKADLQEVKNEFLKWQNPLVDKFDNHFDFKTLNLSIEDTLKSLLPLTIAERRRYILIPTLNNWVCLIDNGHTGTDRTVPEVLGKRLNCKTIFAIYDFQTEDTLLDIFDAKTSNFDLIRSISAINENGWKFEQYGNIQDFENIEYYKSRQIKKRFNYNILQEYLEKIGINISDINFYKPHDTILIEKQGKMFDSTKELSLVEAQLYFKK
jgi:hypothetical protein